MVTRRMNGITGDFGFSHQLGMEDFIKDLMERNEKAGFRPCFDEK